MAHIQCKDTNQVKTLLNIQEFTISSNFNRDIQTQAQELGTELILEVNKW